MTSLEVCFLKSFKQVCLNFIVKQLLRFPFHNQVVAGALKGVKNEE